MSTFRHGGPERYQHQLRGLQKMIDTRGVAALLFEPGTGKTAATLDYMSLLALKHPPVVRVLVVAPLAAVDTWVYQAETFVSPDVDYWAGALSGSIRERGNSLAALGGAPFYEKRTLPMFAMGKRIAGADRPMLKIAVTNLDTFASRGAHPTRASATMADYMLEAVQRYQPHLIVVDESHRIKSAKGNASRLLGRIAKTVDRRIILTGTVMPHSPMDVFGQWRFLEPYAFGREGSDGVRRQATFGAFRDRYAVMGGYMGHQVTGYRNLDEMQDIMARNAAVARKVDALDLPSTTDVEVPVELSPKEKAAYRDMKQSLAAQLSSGALSTATNRLAQMMRLRQITSGHLPDDTGTVNIVGESKVRTIRSIVHDNLAGEKRIVVFCLFTREIEDLQRVLAREGTEIMTISGATPAEDRILLRKRFGSDDPQRIVLIAQIKTLSLAVNELVTASHAIFGSLSQQRDDLIQARDRLNRIGQTRPVTFWYAIAKGTVDDVIMQTHADRTDLEQNMLRHILGKGE